MPAQRRTARSSLPARECRHSRAAGRRLSSNIRIRRSNCAADRRCACVLRSIAGDSNIRLHLSSAPGSLRTTISAQLFSSARLTMSMKFGVLVFPGSNCDHDAYYAIESAARQPVTFLWHASHDLQNCDAVIVPGGFAYGDYLRTGAIAKFAPIMQQVSRFAQNGGLVLGICNGFQILCEAGLLPGA